MHNFEQSAGNHILPNYINIQGYGSGYNAWGSSETRRSPRSLFRENIVHVKKYSLILNSIIPARRSLELGAQKYAVITTRSYSNFSNNGNQDNTLNLKKAAVKVYENLKEDRIKIIKQEIGRSGVYCLINKVNGHSYVGSSINLASRMRNYLNKTFLKNKQNANMPITKALLKYDHSNFTLLILEYVEGSATELLTAKETEGGLSPWCISGRNFLYHT